MSGSRLLAVSALFLLAVVTAGTAAADRVRTTKTTKVFKRTGEQSEIVTKVGPGKTLEVIATQGRWLKVRANGRTGWVTRSSVVELEARDMPRNTRRRPFVDGRSTRRGWAGSAPDDRVGEDAVDSGGGGDDGGSAGDGGGDDDRDSHKKHGSSRSHDGDDDDHASRGGDDDGDRGGGSADDDDGGTNDDDRESVQMVTVTAGKAKLYSRPSRRARPVMTVRRGARLTVLDQGEGNWIRVENEDGDPGWIAADAVEAPGMKRPKRMMAATARLGLATVGGVFKSTPAAPAGSNPPSSYTFGSTAVSIAIGGEVDFAFKKDYYLGASLDYLGCIATPGIRYTSGMMAEDIGFKTHDLDVRGAFGYDFHKKSGMTAWGRLGFHYGLFSVSNLQNLASIPAETFAAPIVGAALRLPRITGKLGASASADLLYPGTRTQTKGNEDGTQAGAMAAEIAVDADYAWKGAWNLIAAYRFGYAKTRWTGTSNRVSGATAAERTDMAHVLTVGLGRSF